MKFSKSTKVIVKQVEDQEVTVEVLAAEIKSISEGVKKLRQGKLTDKALVLLIQNAAPNHGGKYKQSPISVLTIRAVLDGMSSLEKEYLK